MTHRLINTWNQILAGLAGKISSRDLELWITPLKPLRAQENALVIQVPNELFAGVIRQRFQKLMEITAKEMGHELQFVVDGESTPPDRPVLPPPSHPDLNPNFTFAHFVVGSANQFAYSVALAVSQQPGKKYNPLFIYGGVGLGKTHLLHAIGNALQEQHQRYRILYITSEQLTNEVVHAIRFDKLPELHDRFRKRCDLLLIDDIQFLIGKKRTQMEFFYIFNTLYERNKQIVLTSDCPPKELDEIEARLRNRFESGLIADIQPPEYELRVAILKQKAQFFNFSIPSEVLEYIAHHIRSSVRELEGALNRLHAKAKFEGKQITLEFARGILKEYIRSASPQVCVETIIKKVADFYHLKPQDLRSGSRRKDVVQARQVAIYLARKLTSMSLPALGEEFGGRDHTTILHSLQKIEALLKNDHNLETLLLSLERALER